MIIVHGFVWLAHGREKLSMVQQEKGVKEVRPTGPSPHVSVTRGCMHGTKGKTSKY